MAQARQSFNANPFDADLPTGPTARVLRGPDQAAWADGFRFLEAAKDAYEAERRRGYAEGKDIGSQEASMLVAETAVKVDRYVATLDKQIAGLALDIVRRVLNDFDQAELVARAAATALADFRRDKALKVSVHPSAEARVRAHLAGRLPRPDLAITIEADPALGLADCLISSDAAVVNASIDTQLEAMGRVLGLADKSAPA
jgi:type III secretion protein L